jgi:hypothetical protein
MVNNALISFRPGLGTDPRLSATIFEFLSFKPPIDLGGRNFEGFF